MRPILHLLSHLVLPGLVARLGWRRHWLRAWAVLIAVNLIDLDHLLADPVYDPGRCSIDSHPLHSGGAIVLYGLMLVLPRTRMLGVGLSIHIALDGIDCSLMLV